jgi:hypothetical protein
MKNSVNNNSESYKTSRIYSFIYVWFEYLKSKYIKIYN